MDRLYNGTDNADFAAVLIDGHRSPVFALDRWLVRVVDVGHGNGRVQMLQIGHRLGHTAVKLVIAQRLSHEMV